MTDHQSIYLPICLSVSLSVCLSLEGKSWWHLAATWLVTLLLFVTLWMSCMWWSCGILVDQAEQLIPHKATHLLLSSSSLLQVWSACARARPHTCRASSTCSMLQPQTTTPQADPRPCRPLHRLSSGWMTWITTSRSLRRWEDIVFPFSLFSFTSWALPALVMLLCISPPPAIISPPRLFSREETLTYMTTHRCSFISRLHNPTLLIKALKECGTNAALTQLSKLYIVSFFSAFFPWSCLHFK